MHIFSSVLKRRLLSVGVAQWVKLLFSAQVKCSWGPGIQPCASPSPHSPALCLCLSQINA